MQYVMYVRLAILLLELLKDIRAEGVSNDSALVDMLAKSGDVLGIPELKSTELVAVVPELKKLVGLLRELRA